jgi:hypothetical protein
LKATLLVETKLIDSLHNVVKHTSELTESEYEAIEKFAENREKERKEKLKVERLELLSPYTDQSHIYPLGEMDEDSFSQLHDSMKLLFEQKKEAERKAEEARIEAEKQAELARIEAQRIADEKAEAQRLENIELKKKEEAMKALLEAERLKAENERKAEAEKQAKIQAQKDAELKKQQAEKAELEKQLQAKKDAELKAENERKELEKLEAKKAKDLLKSGDKARLVDWIDRFEMPSLELKGMSDESVLLYNNIFDKWNKFQVWAKSEIDKM